MKQMTSNEMEAIDGGVSIGCMVALAILTAAIITMNPVSITVASIGAYKAC